MSGGRLRYSVGKLAQFTDFGRKIVAAARNYA